MIESAKNLVKRLLAQRLLAEERRKRAGLPPEHDGLPPALWGWEVNAAGHMTVQGQDVVALAEVYGTPLHVVVRQRLEETYRAFLSAFQQHYPRVSLGTSYKTNPLPAVLRVLHEQGSCAEVISYFELWLALRLGVPGDRIIFNGPGKGVEALREAVARKVRLINIDSPHEVDVIAAAAAARGGIQDVGIRVVTSVGWSGQFGFSLTSGAAREVAARIARRPELRLRGLHLHLGTGIKDVGTYLTAVREVLVFGRSLAEGLGIPIDQYDLGGGFAVPTVRGKTPWDERLVALGYPARLAIPAECPAVDDYARAIAGLVREFYPENGEIQPELIFEPGRAITSNAQTLLLSVVTTKEAGAGETTLILDGGKNIAMPLGWETHQILPASKMREPQHRTYNVYGPLCHPGDVVAMHKRMPRMESGDIVSIMDAGAYFIPNQMNFSNPRTAVVMVDRGSVALVRQRETFADIVRLDRWPEGIGE